MTKKNSLTLAVALATLTGFSAKAQSFIAYDNTTSYQNLVTSRGNIEIGDEINLIGGAGIVTQFQFEYNFTGLNDAGSGILRFYAKDAASNLKPGSLLFESSSFNLLNGFHQGSVSDISVSVPGTFIWTVEFSGIDGAENAGLLFYNGVTVGGAPGQSFDDHWERNETDTDWLLVDNDLGIDNFGARVTVIPEPGTVALLGLGAGALALAARRRKA